MVAPREMIQSDATAFFAAATPAAGWVLGHVRVDVPGYREHTSWGIPYVIAGTELRFDQLCDAISTGLLKTWGQVSGTNQFNSFGDRLGWLLGFGVEAGVTPRSYYSGVHVPPAGIPLMGVTWTQVEHEKERRALLDRHRRNQGFVWGSALIFACRLIMHRLALEALMTGWCLRGKVTVGADDMINTPLSDVEPRGAITGYVVGVERVGWVDSVEQTAEVEMVIATEE